MRALSSTERETAERRAQPLRRRRFRFSLSNIPIKQRLPLLIGTLLLGVFAISAVASYRAVKESSLEIGRERLSNLTQQFAAISQQSSVNSSNKTFAVASDPAISALLRSPSPITKDRAITILQQFAPTQDPGNLQVELWDANHLLTLTIPEGVSPEPTSLETDFRQCASDPFKSSGTLRAINDTVTAPSVAAVRDAEGKILGYLVRWRKLVTNPQPRQLTDLLGNDATLYFGNTQGDVWTDLTKVVPKPPVSLETNSQVTQYRHNGNTVLGLGRPVAGTPWSIVIEISDKAFVAQTRRFLGRMAIISVVLLALGTAGAFGLSRSITQPLQALTEAVSAISGGDYSKTVEVQHRDELGALAAGFNAMTAKVRTSQRELEENVQALRESQHRLQTVIENLSEGLVVSDLDGQLLNWNRAALDIHGFASVDECLLKLPEFANIFELSDLDSSVLDLEQWPLPRIMRGERLRNLEVRIRRLDSDWNRVFNYGGSVVREASGRLAAVVTMSDITARKLAEEEIRITNQRLEATLADLQSKTIELASMTEQLWQAAKLATMGELAASIAHELNNPLAILALHAEALLERMSADDPKRRAVLVIEQEVERMATLVSNLLLFSRRSHSQTSTVNIVEELGNSLEFILYHIRSHKIKVITNFETGLPSVAADRQQLRQLFLNLLTNSTDAMPEGGTLTLVAKKATLANGTPAVMIEFSDTGIGIKAEDLPKLWEPFFTTKPEGKGTGLGLPICRRIVEDQHGTIDIESQPGAGTTVRLIFPAIESGAI